MRSWIPPRHVRAVAVGLLVADGALLVTEVRDGSGGLVGLRPPGGSIELGEPAARAVEREFREELALDVDASTLVGVCEDIYACGADTGHEIVLVFGVDLAGAAGLPCDGAAIDDDGLPLVVRWVSLDGIGDGRVVLLPPGLDDLLRETDPSDTTIQA